MTVDLTGIAVAVTGGIFTILGLVISAWLASKFKDREAATVLSAAVKNSLGAIQQAATSEFQKWQPRIPGVPASLAVGVQYVIDHAGEAADRFGITPESIASKIEAQIGLANISTNLATTANATSAVAAPLASVVEAASEPPTNPPARSPQ